MKGPELWALSQSEECWGNLECHWCGSPCIQGTTHDDLPPILGVRSKSLAARPSSPWICTGCKLFRQKRRTIWFLGGDRTGTGGFQDSRCPMNYSWLVTDKKAWAIRGGVDLYKALLTPPKRFALSLIDEKGTNLPHLWRVNEAPEWKAGDDLWLTINGTPFVWTVADLEAILSHKESKGLSPGVVALEKRFGAYPPLAAKRLESPKEGAPEWKGGSKKVVS